MIDFSTLQGLTIPEGVVTQIADASGRVLWKKETTKPVVLQVAKQTATTYAGETEYANESFILLDIYPKTNGTVKVTYGGLTKTITDTSGADAPNSQQVYFGTFNGVSDSVSTPTSGALTIEGEYSTFACAAYSSASNKTNNSRCSCITGVTSWGDITVLANYAFYGCTNLTLTSLPSTVVIANYAFYQCTSLALTSLPDSITSIGSYAFYGCTNLALTSLPDSITGIGNYAFYNCLQVDASELPLSLEYLGDSAFYMYSDGTSSVMYNATITIPSGLKEIGDGAFCYYSGNTYALFATLNVLATEPPSCISSTGYLFGDAMTTSSSTPTIIVPKGCSDAYKSATGWSEYSRWITEAS